MMEEDRFIECQNDPHPEISDLLFEGIVEEASDKKGMPRMERFGIFLKDFKGKVLGGATCLIYYGCLYTDLLWVEKGMRKKGAGQKIMQEAERIGKERKCSFATVNTMDWEALPFYQKLGYVIEFERTGYDKESKMYMLRKKL